MPPPRLHSPRLELGPLHHADADAMARYRSDPEVARYQGWTSTTPEQLRTFIANLDDAPFGTPGAWAQLAIRRRDTGDLIGDLGVHRLSSEPRQAEVGITLAADQQGQGFAAEALSTVIGHLFQAWQLHRITASVDPRNTACIALLKRIGMRQEAWFRQSLWFKGAWVDDIVCAVLREEWSAAD